jgi:hypothetical protein
VLALRALWIRIPPPYRIEITKRSFAVDIFFKQALSQHYPKIWCRNRDISRKWPVMRYLKSFKRQGDWLRCHLLANQFAKGQG